jgi:hypothetical protein
VCVSEPDRVLDVSWRIAARMRDVPAEALEDYVTYAANRPDTS